MNVSERELAVDAVLDAVIFDIGGTLVAEAPPATATSQLEVRLLPSVLDDLRELSLRVRLAAATNTSVMTEADVRGLLAPSGVDALLEEIVTSSDIGVAKPDPAVLHVVLGRLGVSASRALFIGDQDTDAQAAAAAGVAYAAVEPGGVLVTVNNWLRCRPGPDRLWPRPVPLIGDATSAAQRAADPAGWRLPESARIGLGWAISARRDIRRYRPDPVDPAILERILEAAHSAPSVGHSQPWRFIIVTDPATRAHAAHIADQERLAQAHELDPPAGQHLLDLQLEGIREAPLGIVVCCDRRVAAAGVLGRRTYPDADMWSCACAIENLWLTARAEGLGTGWVTLFPPQALADLLHIPAGVETMGWLCLGWPDERPPSPGLERASWSKRQPVSEVVLAERWPSGDIEPKPPVSKLSGPSPEAVVAARDNADTLLTPPSSLGALDRAVDRIHHHELVLAGGGGTLFLVGGRHLVARHGVSAYARTVTDDVLEAARAGAALGAAAATAAGLAVEVIDAGSSTGDLVSADALSADSSRQLFDAGVARGELAAGGGPVALGEVGVGNTTVAAALAAVLLDVETPGDVVGQGAGADTTMVDVKRHVVTLAVARARSEHGAMLPDPLVALASLGGPEIAVLAGVTLGAARAGGVVVLDGLATSVAALIAVNLEPAVALHLIAGQKSRETAHSQVLDRLGLEPLLDLRFRAGEGVGACLAVGLLRDALAMRTTTARTR